MKEAQPPQATTVVVVGDGANAERWTRALRAVERTAVERLSCTSEDDLLEVLSRPGVNAVAFATPVADVAAAVRRAVMTGRHVLVCMPVAIRSQQQRALADLSRRRNRVILFDTTLLADENAAFLRKMTAGGSGLWRPRCLRALRTGQDSCSLDASAVDELAGILAVMGLPDALSAAAPRSDDETGSLDSVLLTLHFAGGPVARVDIGLDETERRHELTLVCDGRTVVLDRLDARAPMRIHAAGAHRGPRRGEQWVETITEHPAVSVQQDHAALVAAMFVQAIRSQDVVVSNAADLASATLVWETARESIARGGELLSLPSEDSLGARPSLQLIKGGGRRRSRRALAMPELTIVARG